MAQTIIDGSVYNEEGKSVQAIVTAQAKNSLSITGYTSTDSNGYYKLTYNGSADSIIITVSGLNIGKHSKKVANRSGKVDFVIKEKPIELKEVVVKPPKIRRSGDTLSYLVSAYTDQNDRVIGDVLKKMPGIEVALSGQISYNGKPINKFYIENMDLLQGRYGIATNNIAAKDIATVEVIENHQPIKALKDRIYSEDAAINLKLKEEAKGTLAIAALAGVGYKPIMWNAELTSMYFAKNKQNMNTYKSNNSGNDVTSEFKSFQTGGSGVPSSQLYIQSPSTPPVSQKRYLQNNAHAITTNNLFKIGNGYELNVNGIYYNDIQKKSGYSLSELYLTSDSILSIEERINAKSKIHNAEAIVRLNRNTDENYLNNLLTFSGNWNSDNGISFTKSGNIDEIINQYLNKPSFSITNQLNFIRNSGKNSYNLNMNTGFSSQPHSLKVYPALYNLFGNENEGNILSLNQNAHQKIFTLSLNSSYGLKLNNFNINYNLFTNINANNFNTLLTGNADNIIIYPADSLKNDIQYNTYQIGLYQSYSYKKNTFTASLSLPVTYYLLNINDHIPNKSTTHNKIMFRPSLSASYGFTHTLQISTVVSYNSSVGDLSSIYTGYIMHGYRSLLRNTVVDRLFESQSGTGRLSLSYRDHINTLFGNLSVNYNRGWRNLLYGYNYQGILSIKTTIDQPTKSERYGINFNVDKGIDFMNASIKLSSSFNKGKSEQLVQNNIFNSYSQSFIISPSINFSPISAASLSYSFTYIQSKNYKKGSYDDFPLIKTVSQNGRVNFYPTKAITINFAIEHQYNSATIAENKYTFFADTGIKLKYKQLDFEIEYNNIFNSKQYISASYSDISTYYYCYELRPASILFKIRFKLK